MLAVGLRLAAASGEIKSLAQFTDDLDGNALHLLHVKRRGQRPALQLPLHRWPSAFYRCVEVIPEFSDPGQAGGSPKDAFDAIVPSLSGFPLTGPIANPKGISAYRHNARLRCRLLTETFGHYSFAVAGGDGGGAIAQILAIEHPEAIIGVHLTDIGWHAANGVHTNPTVQISKSRSLAVGLIESPDDLASWIMDRFHSWSGSGDDLEKSVSRLYLLAHYPYLDLEDIAEALRYAA